jgi:poly(A) polymerase
MAARPTRRFGVSDPISEDPPTPTDEKLTKLLENVLREFKSFESPEESQKREEALGKLNALVKEWVKQISIKKGLSEQLAIDAGAKIFTFGSYRIGVNTPGGDIDTLLVCPRHIDRPDFFTDFYATLQKCREVSELSAVPDAFVPLIKMHFDGIPVRREVFHFLFDPKGNF